MKSGALKTRRIRHLISRYGPNLSQVSNLYLLSIWADVRVLALFHGEALKYL